MRLRFDLVLLKEKEKINHEAYQSQLKQPTGLVGIIDPEQTRQTIAFLGVTEGMMEYFREASMFRIDRFSTFWGFDSCMPK